MRTCLLIFLLVSTLPIFSQDYIGVYKLDGGAPSRYYLSLNCDSTFHFINHYDFNAAKSYKPALDSALNWSVENEALILDEEIAKDRKYWFDADLNIVEESREGRNQWIKVIDYNEQCQATRYITFNHWRRTVYQLIPGKQVQSEEEYQYGKLVKRTTYYEFSQEEIDAMYPSVFKKEAMKDPIEKVGASIFLIDWNLPFSKVERWEEGTYSVFEYDREGKRIKN